MEKEKKENANSVVARKPEGKRTLENVLVGWRILSGLENREYVRRDPSR
jgi:hypothetical protein